MSEDITLLKLPKGRLYYYQGNFFMPSLDCKELIRKCRIAIFQFSQKNKELIASDRSNPQYIPFMELA